MIMSCSHSSFILETEREANMGEVLGKEPEEVDEEVPKHLGENGEREEAEGAESEEFNSPSTVQSPPNIENGSGKMRVTFYTQENGAQENVKNQQIEGLNTTQLFGCNTILDSCEPDPKNLCADGNVLSSTVLSNGLSSGVFDMKIISNDQPDGGDPESDVDDDIDNEEDDAGDADDEADFADGETVPLSSEIVDSLDIAVEETKRKEEIKISNDSTYLYSDSSSDDSPMGGRSMICESFRKMKRGKVLSSSSSPLVEPASALSESFSKLELSDNKLLDVADKISENIGKRENEKCMFSHGDAIDVSESILPEVILSRKDLSSGTESSQEQHPMIGTDKRDISLSTDDDNLTLNDEDIKELMRQRRRESCSCEACQSKRLQLQEQRKLQGAWMELRQFVRGIYHMIMETPPNGVVPVVDNSQDEYMKAIAKSLAMSDPHQLYHRLQAQVHEFAAAVKIKLVEISEASSQPEIATVFFEVLFDSYDKLTAAAKRVSPVLESLEAKHLSRFNLTWEVLNKAIYYYIVYNNEVISSKLPEMVSLGKAYHDMIRFYVAFDDEMNIVGAMWRESSELLNKYNNQQAKIRAKQQMLLRDWEMFKAQRKRMDQSASEDRMEPDGLEGDEELEVVVCPACNLVQSCPCDECCLTHLFHCPAHQPSSYNCDYSPLLEGQRLAGDGAGDGSVSEGPVPAEEVVERSSVEQKCECHVCTAPPVPTEITTLSNFAPGCCCSLSHPLQSYGHPYHFTNQGQDSSGVYPHLYNVHPSLLNPIGTNLSLLEKPSVEETGEQSELSSECVVEQEPSLEVHSESEGLIISREEQDDNSDKLSHCRSHSLQASGQPIPVPSVLVPNFSTGHFSTVQSALNGCPAVDFQDFPNVTGVDIADVDFNIPLMQFSGDPSGEAFSGSQTTLDVSTNDSPFSGEGANIECETSSVNDSALVLKTVQEKPDVPALPVKPTPSSPPLIVSTSVPDKSEKIQETSSKSTPSPSATSKLKQGHTCSSTKHKQHTHSPNRKDPKNCDCCFCEMFGHGAPPAAPTSHRFHENRQRLRSKLNKSRASKQQALTVAQKSIISKPAAAPHALPKSTVGPPSTGGSVVRSPPSTGGSVVRSPPSTGGSVVRSPPSTGGSVVRSTVIASTAKTVEPNPARPASTGTSILRPTAVGANVVRTATFVTKPCSSVVGNKPSVAVPSDTRPTIVKAPVKVMPRPSATGTGPGMTTASGASTARAIANSLTAVVTSPSGQVVRPVPLKVNSEPGNRIGSKTVKVISAPVSKGVTEGVKIVKSNVHVASHPVQNQAGTSSRGSSTTQSSTNAGPTPNIAAMKVNDAGQVKLNQKSATCAKSNTVTNLNQRHSTAGASSKDVSSQAGVPLKVALQKPATTPVQTDENKSGVEDNRPIEDLLDFIEGGGQSQSSNSDSRKAAKRARQKQKKLEEQKEEERLKALQAKTPEVTITMLKNGTGTQASSKIKQKAVKSQSGRVQIAAAPNMTAQTIRDRIRNQVGEASKTMSSDQPQMVTIRRVMEPNSKEPTVTITLKGATPDKDKVLFTLVNGQNEVVHHDVNNAKPKSKKQKRIEKRFIQSQQEALLSEELELEVEEQSEEIDFSELTKTQKKKLRRLQRKQEEERLLEEKLKKEEEERLRKEKEEERMRKEQEKAKKTKGSKKQVKKDKVVKQQEQFSVQQQSKIQTQNHIASDTGRNRISQESKGVSDQDDEFVVPEEMTKKERKRARKLQKELEEEQRKQRQKEEEERERLRQLELKELKKKQREQQKLKQQQQNKLEKEQQKQKEQERRQMQKQAQQQQKQKSKQSQQKQVNQKQNQMQQKGKQSGNSKITTSIVANSSYMPPVGSLEWTTQALAASRPNVTIQPTNASSSGIGGLEQRFSSALTLNGKPLIPPPRQPSPDLPQDFSLENLKLPPGITITKVDPSQVQQRKPPVAKPQVTKTVVTNPAPTTIIAAPLSGSRPQDTNSNVIVVDTGKLKQDIAKKDEEPEQVVTRKKKNKNKKGMDVSSRTQMPPQLPPFIYGMNSVSITPAGQAAVPPPPPQAAIIKVNGNMVTIRNPAMHPNSSRYSSEAPDKDPGNSKKFSSNGGAPVSTSRTKDNSSLPPRFANAKFPQQPNGLNGFMTDFTSAKHRPQHFETTNQGFEAPKRHFEAPPRHYDARHCDSTTMRHFEPRHYDGAGGHFDTGSHKFNSTHHFEAPQARHFDHTGHHFEHSGHHFEATPRRYEHTSRHCDPSAHHFNSTSLGVHHPPNYAAAIDGKKTKLKNAYNNDDWQLLDNVFAPKDIDLNDGNIDDDERELEAFKRFCLQSVPPKRKEKVHLNIKDIVLKKKSSPVSCT